jgi:signal transduction histidine kinase
MARAAGRRESWMVASGLVLLVLAVLLLFRAWGVWVGDPVVWPLILATGGGALIWRQSQAAPEDRAARARLPREAVNRAGVGAALVVGGALLSSPWWVTLTTDLRDERTARIRSPERAAVAAHLHDSVLQTLALIQKSSASPTEVTRLARGQERELRNWLYAERHDGGTFAAALERATAEVEEVLSVPVDVVVVGDCALDERLGALVAASREAVVNAAKHSGAPTVDVYAEVEPAGVSVFVRDRGRGFDPAGVPTDRHGLSGSVVGRMARHGGTASIRSTIGSGTEVRLELPRG